MSNWRDIRKYTGRATGRIDRSLVEKQRKESELTNIAGQAVSLYSKWSTGKKEQKALEEFGTGEGLTFDKKTKSFYGTMKGEDAYTEEWTDEKGDEFWDVKEGTADQHYKISPAELKTMQSFQKYTDKGISDFISTKEGGIKKGYQYTPPTEPDRPNVPFVPQEEDEFAEPPEVDLDDKRIQTLRTNEGEITDTRASMKMDGKRIGSARYIESGPNTFKDWKTAADVDIGFRKTAVDINKAKEDEMRGLLDIQTKDRADIETKRMEDEALKIKEKDDEREKRRQETISLEKERIRMEEEEKERKVIESVEKINKMESTSGYYNKIWRQ